jgi:signal transduction histidine kinase
MVRIQTGTVPLNLQQSNMAQLRGSALKTFSRMAEERKVDLRLIPCAKDELDLEIDPWRIEQVLGNLISNAMKFTARGGHIEISARREGNRVIVCVRDTGRGIPAELQKSVFEPYFQAMPTDAVQGIGLGLAIVKNLVETHGGQVWLNSTSGLGSAFFFALPASSSEIPMRKEVQL